MTALAPNPPATLERRYRTAQAARAAGITYAVLSRWIADGILPIRDRARGSGVPLLLTRHEVRVAALLSALLAAGLNPEHLRNVTGPLVRELEDHGPPTGLLAVAYGHHNTRCAACPTYTDLSQFLDTAASAIVIDAFAAITVADTVLDHDR